MAKSVTLIDLIQIYNFNTDRDLNDAEALFEDIDIDSRLDKKIVIDSIIDECGAMRAIYNTTTTFKYFSDNFFKKYKWNIGKMVDTLEMRYNPLTNKTLDWTETTTIEQNLDTAESKEENRTKDNTGTQIIAETGTQTTNNTGTQTTNDTGTQIKADSGTQTTANTGTQVDVFDEDKENTISAMNASTYQPDTKQETDSTNTRTDNLQSQRTDNLQSQRTDNLQSQRTDALQSQRTDNLQNARTDNLSEEINATNDRSKTEALTWDETDTHTEHGTNNITFQELIEKERKVAQFSIYNWIAKKYASELFLLVY